MRVIIPGGTGLIGQALAAELLDSNHEVIVLSRNPDKAPVSNNVQVVGWDARTPAGWASLITQDTAIVNLTGAGLADKRWTDKRKEVLWNSRIHAGGAVVAAIQQAEQKPKVVIQMAAVGYYGPRGDEILTEDGEAGNDYLATLCKAWEESSAAVMALGVRHVVIRSGVVLSMQGKVLPRMLLPMKLFVGGPLGNGKQGFPWIHIKDEVRVLHFLIENEATSGVYNLTAPETLTNKQFVKILGKVLRRPAFMPVPSFVLKLLFGEMATVLLDGQQVSPNRLEKAGFDFQFPTAEKAVQNLLATRR